VITMSVCLSDRKHISGHTRPIFTKFSVGLHVTHGRDSFILWRRNDMICISGFMGDVVLAHEPRQLNVAVQLSEAQPTCSLGLGYAVNGA